MQRTVYKITCKNTEITDCYIGQTKDFRERLWHHKGSCNNEKSKKYNMKLYRSIRENGGWTNWEMIAIETFTCNDEKEAREKELIWYEHLNSSLNTQMPLRERQKWVADNKEKIKEQKRKWYLKNKISTQNKCSEENQPTSTQNLEVS